MEVDFDKQIDTILRDLAKGENFAESPPASHLDADELSAFAENVLPPKARLRAMEHLADCQRCRKTLSTFVSLNDPVESEIINEEAKTIAAIPKIPWYRQLFAFPNLSFVMGAMALVLVGMVGILLWQGAKDSQNNVAMNEPVAEKVKGPSGVSSDGEAQSSETYSTNSANAAANSAAQPAANVAPSSANTAAVSNSTVSSVNTTKGSEPKPTGTPVAGEENVRGMSLDTPATESKSAKDERDKVAAKEDVSSKGGEIPEIEREVSSTPTPRATDDTTQRAETSQNRVAQNQIMTPDGGSEAKRNAPSPPPSAKKVPARNDNAGANDLKDEDRKNKAEAKPTVFKDVGGKSFRSVNGIWTDTGYRGGSVNTVKRGSQDYKKLDSGLRSTADYLGGTVIIVWKGKNYRIQ